ncbi:hypothetical protein [Ruminococcus sp.]|uniref:hypothetical protein n=1 Tax=Ruminococcus sp. TaxID=41978 RepID=UPI0025E95307|nr:hypothetical protein [Ruminococcus sp.]MBO4523744.1 hypothetical protein [Ruminococcus sp.]
MDNSINIEQIMADIKREIKEKGLTADMLSFEDIPYKKTSQSASPAEALDFVTTNYYVEPFREFKGSRLKVFFKKIVRKIVKCYVEPIVMDQNDFNANSAIVLKAVSEYKSEDISSRVEVLEVMNKDLLKRLENLERENAELHRIISREKS